jgi:hypothetical protein
MSKKQTVATSEQALAALRAAVTSADFSAALEGLEEAMQGARGRLSEAHKLREAAIFSGDGLAKASAAATAAEQEVSTLQAAIEGAARRKADAEQREDAEGLALRRQQAKDLAAEFEADMRETARLTAQLYEAYVKMLSSRFALERMADGLQGDGVPVKEVPSAESIARGVIRDVPLPAASGLSHRLAQVAPRYHHILRVLLSGSETLRVRSPSDATEGGFGVTRGRRSALVSQILGQLPQTGQGAAR